MVCMSPSVTSDIIDKLATDYDAEVFNWTEELSKHIQVSDIPELMPLLYFLCVDELCT